MKRLMTAGAMLTLTLAVAACEDGGGLESLPTSRASTEATSTAESSPRVTRTAEPDPTRTTAAPDRTRATDAPEPTRTRTADEPEPTRTVDEPEPTRTTDAPEPERTTDAPEPERTTDAPEPERTTDAPEPTRTAAAPATTPTSASAVAVAGTDDGGVGAGLIGWLLLIGLFATGIALLLVNRSRRASAWRAAASSLAAETRTATGPPLRTVLTEQRAADRALSWPPVREDLAGLVTRWADLSTRAPDTAAQASAAQTAGILRDLVAAVDAENNALATGRDWHLLRPEVNNLLDGLVASLPPPPPTPPGAAAPPPPGPAGWPQPGSPGGPQSGSPGGPPPGSHGGPQPGPRGGPDPNPYTSG